MPLCAIGEVAPDFISAEIKSMVICIAELMGEILAASMGEIWDTWNRGDQAEGIGVQDGDRFTMPLCAIGEVAPDFISAEIKSMVICIAELMGEILAASMGEIRAVCVRLCEKEAMVKMIFAA
eukprot:CAMPEP_0115866040 /NCGR_PEP_ID=MMETSP0287-20121206/20043_1 /TAXON_ID=412157 /ORGANISM="Chrysochromulina rotalis, Strain UIO044" /LENGTH=122 /DNA_ID=CAMNT_0003320593 /DNA_START=1244 /DNA_END=1613 /DNA_ORIENTATION=-